MWKRQSRNKRPRQTHRQAANQVLEIVWTDAVRNDHHRKERNQRREHHAVNENYEYRFLQVRQLRVLDFPVDLRQRFRAAHGQHGMPKPDQHGKHRKVLCDMRSR
jgi:hypothetical protein